jgi:hypothetical protein
MDPVYGQWPPPGSTAAAHRFERHLDRSFVKPAEQTDEIQQGFDVVWVDMMGCSVRRSSCPLKKADLSVMFWRRIVILLNVFWLLYLMSVHSSSTIVASGDLGWLRECHRVAIQGFIEHLDTSTINDSFVDRDQVSPVLGSLISVNQ